MKTIKKIIEKDERIITTTGKEPTYFVSAMGDSAMSITARFWVDGSDYWQTNWDLTQSTKEALDKAGIVIPFPTQTLEFTEDTLKALKK